jgi:hypothetical protein
MAKAGRTGNTDIFVTPMDFLYGHARFYKLWDISPSLKELGKKMRHTVCLSNFNLSDTAKKNSLRQS